MRFLPVFVIAVVVSAAGSGCSSTYKTARVKKKPISEYEKQFDPSRHEAGDTSKKRTASHDRAKVKTGVVQRADTQTVNAATADTSVVERTEKVMGWRVQLYSCSDLSDAEYRRAQFQSALDSISVELIFDSPTYKLRIGNCITREEAESLRDYVRTIGMPDAWVVRDYVVRIVK
jgi:uncharacterized protein YpuA (DUF1002 family)